MISVKDTFDRAVSRLLQAGVENARTEAFWLLEEFCSVNRAKYISGDFSSVTEEQLSRFQDAVSERIRGVPVQYLLGEWEFYGRTFKVGSGVLIPREETCLLVEAALGYLSHGTRARVADLCSGTGCIGITVAAERPDAEVIMIEKSDEAAGYLKRNLSDSGVKNASLVMGDIFTGPEGCSVNGLDVILSNPPYIPSSELPSLQKEVLFEPASALDGGEDGMDFYRAIAEKWLPALKGGGLIALECAEDQQQRIAGLISDSCENIRFGVDFNGLPRTVTATKKQ